MKAKTQLTSKVESFLPKRKNEVSKMRKRKHSDIFSLNKTKLAVNSFDSWTTKETLSVNRNHSNLNFYQIWANKMKFF